MMRKSSSMASTLAVPARKIACESARMILFISRAPSGAYPQKVPCGSPDPLPLRPNRALPFKIRLWSLPLRALSADCGKLLYMSQSVTQKLASGLLALTPSSHAPARMDLFPTLRLQLDEPWPRANSFDFSGLR
jgi:hypothetical protein